MSNRTSPAFQLDGRSTLDLLGFLRRYSRRIPYRAGVSWDALLFNSAMSDAALADLIDGRAAGDGKLPPHQALLVAYLRLLSLARSAFNAHAADHWALYVRDYLGLAPRPATPDRIAVRFDLNKGAAAPVRLDAGTLINAGRDDQGMPLRYRLDAPVEVNRARIAELGWVVVSDKKETRRHVALSEAGKVNFPDEGGRLFDVRDAGTLGTTRVMGAPQLAMSGGTRKLTITFENALGNADLSVALSSAKGWMPLAQQSVDAGKTVYEFLLSAQADAVEPLTDPTFFLTGEPLLKIDYAGEQLPEVAMIKVSVTGVTDLAYRDGSGATRVAQKSYVFGSTAPRGADIRIAARDWFGHDGKLTVTVELNWIGLPHGSFNDHYHDYKTAIANDSVFQVKPAIVGADGIFDSASAVGLSLFQDNADAQVAPTGKPLKISLEKGFSGDFFDHGTVEAQPAYLALRLEPQDFLQGEYALVAPDKKPNRPYLPQVQGVTIGYEFTLNKSHFDTNWELTPYGFELPPAGSAGLLIGLADIEPGQDISLFWHVMADASLSLNWTYRSDMGWKPLGGNLRSDATNSLRDSAMWLGALPEDAEAAWLPNFGMAYWLCAMTDAVPASCPWLYGVDANSCTATLDGWEQISATHWQGPLAAGSASSLTTPVPAVRSVVQRWPSFGGRVPETDADLRSRAQVLLTTRQRAVTSGDIAALVRDGFDAVLDVAAARDGTGATGVTIHVMPKPDALAYDDPEKPAFSGAFLTGIKEYIAERAAPQLQLQVVNANYVDFTLEPDVRFISSVTDEAGRARLKADIERHFSLAGAADPVARIGKALGYYDIVTVIQDLDYVADVIGLVIKRTIVPDTPTSQKSTDNPNPAIFAIDPGPDGVFLITCTPVAGAVS